jgi:hypothetical protein
LVQLTGGDEKGQCDWQVECGACLYRIRGRQIDCVAPWRNGEVGVRQRGIHALAAFLDGARWQANDGPTGQSHRRIQLDDDLGGINAIDRRGMNGGVHPARYTERG